MPEFTDQLGRKILLNQTPGRIVSVVPSQTEFLYDLGLGDDIIGQTLFCIHPEKEFKKSVKVGGTKKLQLDKIRSLKPDIIIANKEENDQKQIEELASEFPVWVSDIYDLDNALNMMESLGQIFKRESEAQAIINPIRESFNNSEFKDSISALYLIWKDPYMAAGPSTFINDMLLRVGLINVIGAGNSRYPELGIDVIRKLNPEVILLSSEPFPFSDKHIDEIKGLFPGKQVLLVDGEMFSWYGSRLRLSIPYFNKLRAGISELKT